jgi:hypothetical protein
VGCHANVRFKETAGREIKFFKAFKIKPGIFAEVLMFLKD